MVLTCAGAGHARDQDKKNKKTQIKDEYLVFISVY
jgi:hypothetical protein